MDWRGGGGKIAGNLRKHGLHHPLLSLSPMDGRDKTGGHDGVGCRNDDGYIKLNLSKLNKNT